MDLLLNTIMLSVPISGSHSNNFLSFSHGEYFYSLFQSTINTELLRSLGTTVPRLMKASSQNPTMVIQCVNQKKNAAVKEYFFSLWSCDILWESSPGQFVAEWYAGPQLQRALREEDSGKTASGGSVERMDKPAVMVGGKHLDSRKQDGHSSAPLQAPPGFLKRPMHVPEVKRQLNVATQEIDVCSFYIYLYILNLRCLVSLIR